jgi:hypothetical protein
MPRDPVDLCCDAVGQETRRSSVYSPRQSLPWTWLYVCHPSDCGLQVAEHCHRLHSMLLQYFSLLDRHPKPESDRPQFGVEDLHGSSAQKAVARPLFISVLTHCRGSHSAIVCARSICPPHLDPCSDFGFFLSYPALYGAFAAVLSSSMVVLTTGSSPGAGQFMPLVVLPCSCSALTALQIGAPEEVLLCSYISLLLHAFSILAANSCCLAPMITGAHH